MNEAPSPEVLPEYQCHKRVRAVKIKYITLDGAGIGAYLIPEENIPGVERIWVDPGYMRKHNPQPGGYYVRYKDGYQSFSPAEAFEEGYVRMEDDGSDR